MSQMTEHIDICSSSGATVDSPTPSITFEPDSKVEDDECVNGRRHATEIDDFFYFHETDFVTIQVEDRLFKAQRATLTAHSPYFEGLLGYTQRGFPKCGSSIEESLYLDGVAKEDFQCYLITLQSISLESQKLTVKWERKPFFGSYALYDFQCTRETKDFTFEEWRAVLRLAKMWRAGLVEKKALDGIEATAISLEKLEIGLKHDVRKWVLAGLRDLVTREFPLVRSDAPWIDETMLEKVTRAREHRYKALVLRLITGEVRRPVCTSCRSDFTGDSRRVLTTNGCLSQISWTLTCAGGVGCKGNVDSGNKKLAIEEFFNCTVENDSEQWRRRQGDIDFILQTFFPDLVDEDDEDEHYYSEEEW